MAKDTALLFTPVRPRAWMCADLSCSSLCCLRLPKPFLALLGFQLVLLVPCWSFSSSWPGISYCFCLTSSHCRTAAGTSAGVDLICFYQAVLVWFALGVAGCLCWRGCCWTGYFTGASQRIWNPYFGICFHFGLVICLSEPLRLCEPPPFHFYVWESWSSSLWGGARQSLFGISRSFDRQSILKPRGRLVSRCWLL